MRTPFIAIALLALPLVACNNKVFLGGSGGSGGSSECGDPPAPTGGYCPPAWQCIDGAWVDTAGACPEPVCPVWTPTNGSPCELIGQVCTFDVPCGDLDGDSAVCTSEGWMVSQNYCMPEPVCPDSLPVVGSDCSGWVDAYYCSYEVTSACGSSWTGVWCDTGTMQWVLGQEATACDCAGLPTEVCNVTAACQWLEPGCGDTPIAAGCYPTTGCDDPGAACAADTACTETSYDPCFYELCDACSGSYFTCLPVPGGA